MVQAELALVGSRVVTMDSTAEAEALAVAGGRLLKVGSRAEVEDLCGPRTSILDVSGEAVLPGFIDTHMHLQKIAREMAMLHLDGARSLADVLRMVRGAALAAGPDEWIRSFGDDNAWHERQLAEGRLPLREELDAGAPGHAVFIYRGGAAALNSAAVGRLEGRLESLSDGEWDSSRGWLRGPATKRIEAELPKPSREQELEQLGSAAQRLLGAGVTSLVDPGLPAGFEAAWKLYGAARSASVLPQRVYLMNRLDENRDLAEELARVEAGPALPRDGEDQLLAWSIKILLDGEFENAWMRDGEEASGCPLQRWTPAELAEIVQLCADRRWPLCVHAMGGAAIDEVIDTIGRARADGAHFAPGEVSIAHAFLASPENARACRELGIAVSVQPLLGYVFADAMVAAWGETAERANPFAMFLAEGVAVAGGSDTLPFEPLRGARYAVDRRSADGNILGCEHALNPVDALKLFTANAGPYMCRSDVGVLADGNAADFVVWDEDPLETPPDGWLELKPQLAVIGGQIVWSA